MTSACFSRGHTGFSRNATLVATVNPPALAGGVFNFDGGAEAVFPGLLSARGTGEDHIQEGMARFNCSMRLPVVLVLALDDAQTVQQHQGDEHRRHRAAQGTYQSGRHTAPQSREHMLFFPEIAHEQARHDAA